MYDIFYVTTHLTMTSVNLLQTRKRTILLGTPIVSSLFLLERPPNTVKLSLSNILSAWSHYTFDSVNGSSDNVMTSKERQMTLFHQRKCPMALCIKNPTYGVTYIWYETT